MDRKDDQSGYLTSNEGQVKWQPVRVYENFRYSDDQGIYTPPFASREEAWGFLSGSESVFLCSKTESLYSRGFVQCGCALIRNRNSGLVSVIHQSDWSAAAGAILAMQRPDDIDVVVMNGPIGHMAFDTVDYFHKEKPFRAYEAFARIDRDNWMNYPESQSQWKDVRHVFGDYSRILGLSTKEVENMFFRAKKSLDCVGRAHLIGNIGIPGSVEQLDRWSLVYRPTENVIYIYVSGTKQLFRYQGFPR